MNSFQKLLDIRSSSDPQGAIESISAGVSIRGYNMWLLFCSAVLASIGLDTSSTAVVIGAMLISPLMSPIIGIGLALGIHDNILFIRSIKNFIASAFLSLIAAILYFSVSPFAYPTAEIEARTYPTLLDVLIAFFGGVAGIVSASRSGISNAIPGVAIATALMPPLCTAGYGIATGQWYYFAGAFYLFFINAVFISLATYCVVLYMHFPKRSFASRSQRNYYVAIFLIITLVATVPSVYFLYSVYKRQRVNSKIEKYVLKPIRNQGNEILKWELSDRDSVVWIKLYHSGSLIRDSLKNQIAADLASNGMRNYELQPARVNMTKEEVNQLSADVSRQMFQQLQLELIQKMNERQKDTLTYLSLNNEVKAAFPFIDTLYQGWLTLPNISKSVDTLPVAFFKTSETANATQFDQLYRFLKIRLGKDSVVLIPGR